MYDLKLNTHVDPVGAMTRLIESEALTLKAFYYADLSMLYTDTKGIKDRLCEKMEWLAGRMQRVAAEMKQTDEQPCCYTVNSLGEVQSNGSEIDILCATYALNCAHLQRAMVRAFPERFSYSAP